MKSEDVLLGGLYNEWTSTLWAYHDQLCLVELNIQQLLCEAVGDENVAYLQALKNDLQDNQRLLGQLLVEVENARATYLQNRDENLPLTIGEMMERNKLREKMRKLEQSTFMIKYRVSQYLLKAS